MCPVYSRIHVSETYPAGHPNKETHKHKQIRKQKQTRDTETRREDNTEHKTTNSSQFSFESKIKCGRYLEREENL